MVNTSDHLNVNALAAAVDAEKEGAFMSCNLLLSASPQHIEGYHSVSTVDQHLLLTLSEFVRNNEQAVNLLSEDLARNCLGASCSAPLPRWMLALLQVQHRWMEWVEWVCLVLV